MMIIFTKWIAIGAILFYNDNAFLCKNIDIFPERNFPMISMQEILVIAAVLVALIGALRSSWRKRREYKNRDAARKLELVLQPRETIQVICPQKKGRVILTSKRILFETRDGFNAVLIKNIKKVQGNNEKGNRTTVPANMVRLTLQAEQVYEIRKSSPEFEEFAKQLLKKTTKKKTVK